MVLWVSADAGLANVIFKLPEARNEVFLPVPFW